MTSDDEWLEESGLLDGLEGAARAERAELIPWLLEQGVTVEQIRSAYQPMLLASRRLLGDDGQLVSPREISERTGIDLDFLQRLQRASGLPRAEDPDAPSQMRIDGDALGYAQRFRELGFDEDQVVLVVQVLTEGLARAAEVMRYAALAAVSAPGATELDIAKRTEALLQQVAPLLGPMIADMLRLQLLHLMEIEAVSAGERAEGLPLPGAREVTIAFADLVGFTRLGEVVPPEDLERLAHQLTDLARDVAEPPVRYVKSIGDEVMLVSSDPAAMLDAMLTLSEATSEIEDFPRLRTGLATGLAVSRAGDWFGGAVNLASRVTGASRPGAILVSESTREAIGDDERFHWSFAGARRLKHIKDEVKLFRARRAD
ncbi:adenylate/guanylate cyclase domain-containing protein [Mycolicibacterium grossiae]|uniref:Adenylate/guanylate cyclase domain-containing protein n=1 Tax=Mycolicibacterium grossiae TaxID=1552759 RepID=A0A1E8Q610_9MYCO|nr:adenylate/guanylate cyclase domain-containing protein [Mycolicibacterium grossiae]OFJ53896.1 adenylate/guanylate cyclase domain-containing protein [Mycolicibacterium grossiae]QEM47677.1 adenylate/guanylate cyclase domain-containing protein [Mycolicibacterium grossiae]